MNNNDIKKKILSKLYGISYYLEMFISLLLIVVIIFLSVKLVINIFDINFMLSNEDVFTYFMENAMSLAVGVELIKMLCKHSASTVVEVLLFAIARQIIVSHSSVMNMVAGVLCIVALLATRKFLFLPDDKE
jgi:uncharacterized membrane protein (DUF373 family)